MRLLLLATALLLPKQTPVMPRHHTLPPLPTQRFLTDMRAKNLEDILALYAPGATFIQPDGAIINNQADLRRLYQQVFATFDSNNLTLKQGGLGGSCFSDNRGCDYTDTGTYTEDLRNRATKVTQHLCGGYSITWHSADNTQYLITRMEWTSLPCNTAKVK